MARSKRIPSYRVYGIGIVVVLLFMLAPLFGVLARQAEKEQRGTITCYSGVSFPSEQQMREDTFGVTITKERVYTATVIVLRCDEKGTVLWYERDSLRFEFSWEQRNRFRDYFQKLLRNTDTDSSRVLLAEVQFHPATTCEKAIYVLDAGAQVGYSFFIGNYNAPRKATDSWVRLFEHRKVNPTPFLMWCGTWRMSQQPKPEVRPTGIAGVYDDVMRCLGFTPEMYKHNFAWFGQ